MTLTLLAMLSRALRTSRLTSLAAQSSRRTLHTSKIVMGVDIETLAPGESAGLGGRASERRDRDTIGESRRTTLFFALLPQFPHPLPFPPPPHPPKTHR